jgi:hypothetical protein
MAVSTAFDTEIKVQRALQEREGGEREVDTPAGLVDLVTDEWVIEIKHIIDWKDGLKVLLFMPYLPSRKPRLHLFGGYTKEVRVFIEQALERLNIAVSFEQDPY